MQYLRLLRLSQWTKNLLVFAALLFTGSFGSFDALYLSGLAFVAMGLVSSAVYVFNDILDAPKDRFHPVKKNRPIASGAVPVAGGVVLGMLCLAGGIALGALVGWGAVGVLWGYVALQALYNFGLKGVPVADVFSVSLGFILRAVLGAVAIEVAISGWLLFCTFAIALLLSLGKRRHEFVLMGDDREMSRAGLSGYTREALDGLLLIAACCSVLSYGIYAIQSESALEHPALIYTALFVFYGVARYVFLVFAKDEGGEPDALLIRDKHILFCVVLFVAVAALAFRGFPVHSFGGAWK